MEIPSISKLGLITLVLSGAALVLTVGAFYEDGVLTAVGLLVSLLLIYVFVLLPHRRTPPIETTRGSHVSKTVDEDKTFKV